MEGCSGMSPPHLGKRARKTLEQKKMEREPAYRLGVAISVIECFLGKDGLSLTSPSNREFVQKRVRNWAEKFLEKEKKIAEELSTA